MAKENDKNLEGRNNEETKGDGEKEPKIEETKGKESVPTDSRPLTDQNIGDGNIDLPQPSQIMAEESVMATPAPTIPMDVGKQTVAFSIGRKISAAFGLILVLFVVLGIVVLRNVANMSRQFEFVVEHDAPVIANARQLEKLIVDMETGQRGFIITSNEEFLEPYNKGIEAFEKIIDKEKKLVSDNPSQVKALEHIEELQQQWQTKAAKPEIAMGRKVAKGSVNSRQLQEILAKISLEDELIFSAAC